jgi:hypothetical protein
MNKGQKKVYNWEVEPKTITSEELLDACLDAFNELPNKRLENSKLGFPNTYAIASRIDGFKREFKEEKENLTTF